MFLDLLVTLQGSRPKKSYPVFWSIALHPLHPCITW